MFDDWFQRMRGEPEEPLPSRTPGPLRRPDGSTFDLALYKYDSCPYCRRVLRAIDALHIEGIEMRDILMDREHRHDLIEATGRGTVPCLVIDGRYMHESADIVRWLRERAKEEPAA